jgi:predicted ATP-binding protein involved in virulence
MGLNPRLSADAARETPGVLLNDEVDMHLHPRWQQLVIELLGNAFSALQVIVMTHSPHVLSTVDKDSIRVIRVRDGQGIVETPLLQTRGVESADVLASVMGVDPMPQIPEARDLKPSRTALLMTPNTKRQAQRRSTGSALGAC